MTNDEFLEMWTIYDHPSDYPDHYVARLFKLPCGGFQHRPQPVATDEVKLSTDLQSLREIMWDLGLVCFQRDPSDDPTIVETWL